MLARLLEEFYRINRANSAYPRGKHGRDRVNAYRRSQEELFHLAQVICALAEPEVQARLTKARREIVEQLAIRMCGPGDAMMRRDPLGRVPRWYEIQITPELHVDPELRDVLVLRKDLQSLRQTLREQHVVVRRLVSSLGRLAN